jgi:hypothetical protein
MNLAKTYRLARNGGEWRNELSDGLTVLSLRDEHASANRYAHRRSVAMPQPTASEGTGTDG